MTKHSKRPAPAPVYFVDPATGDVLTLDLRTAEYKAVRS
jgi:hypothetical protein